MYNRPRRVTAVDLRATSTPERIGEYELGREIGRGAMGSIHLARDTLLERDVALKLIAAQALDEEAKALFFNEARALARVAHPNVVAVHRFGEIEQRPYLVTELVRGGSLADLPKPVAAERALSIGIGIARGLAAAHRKSVLHRDIKPDNVMLGEAGEIKLVDFGLAKLFEDGEPSGARRLERLGGIPAVVSASGEIAGTPLYMAPETLHGEPASVRSDVYGVGAVLYELLAGVAPRETLPAGVSLPDWISASPRPLQEQARSTSIDPRLVRLVHRCLALVPAERFPSADALAEALEALVEDATSEGDVPAGNPYRGLEAFEVEHQGVFFGRDAETRAVLRRLRDDALVVVAGDSGVGKSSLCKAGVLPRVMRGALGHSPRRRIVTLVPGAHPLAALSGALSSVLGEETRDLTLLLDGDPAALYREVVRALPPEEGLFVLIDQLEEICTLAAPGEAALFGAAVLRLCMGPRVRAVLTLRADFIGAVAALGPLGADLDARLFLLRPMTEEGIRAAITRPALRKGVAFESEDLVDELVRAATETPGGLPLLEFAMAELWSARDEATGMITTRSLRAIGSVAGALTRHADEVIHDLGPGGQDAARSVLVKLVGADRTRARRTSAELGGDDPKTRAALDALVRRRLVVARKLGQESLFEVAHEALLREWQSLRRWLDETTEQQALLREIEQAAELWHRRGRREDETWTGDALNQAVSRIRRWTLELVPVARAFIEAGRERQRRGRRRRRWLVFGSVGALAALALASTAAAVAFSEKERQAIAQQTQIRLAAADMGEIDLALEPFDWDVARQRKLPTNVPAGLEFRLYTVDAVDPHSSGRLFGPEDMRRSDPVVSDGVLRVRLEVRSGPAFLEILGRGGSCPSSWVYLQRLPGYTDRLSRGPIPVTIPVPTCQASLADTVEVPAGPFFLNVGAPDEDHGPDDELVELPAYLIDRTEVTRGAFDVFGSIEPVTGDGAARTSFLDLDRPGGERLPIVGVNSLTAASYCRFMGKELPTIEQWQKAMRGGTVVNGAPNPDPKRLRPWIGATSKHPMNIDDGDTFETLAPVGSFAEDTSPYGVVDLAGNVSEWSREKVSNPELKGLRFILGAGWGNPLAHSGWRNKRPDRFFDFSIGARCVQAPGRAHELPR